MPKLDIEVPHTLGADEAKSRLARFTEALQSKFKDQVSDVTQSWSDDTMSFGFKTFGIKIAGDMNVYDDRVHVDGDLPYSAVMFKGKIESEMKQQLSKLLS